MEHSPLPPPQTSARPQPPPGFSYPTPAVAVAGRARAGDLTGGWRTITIIAWIGVVIGLGTVWYTSRTLGLSTWWLGPETEPRLIVLNVAPFVMPLAVAVAAIRHLRWLPFGGLLAAATTAAVGVGDTGRVPGLAAVEIALGAAGALVSVASVSGMYRPG